MVRIEDDSQVSTRRLSVGLEISKTSILKRLHLEKYHPYHFTPVQNLLPADLPLRYQFASAIRTGKILITPSAAEYYLPTKLPPTAVVFLI